MKKLFSIITISIPIIVIGWAVFLSPASAITVPHYLGVEGRLTNSSNTALTGTYDITFRIYKALTGGSATWTEIQSSVSVSSGYFNVNLGDTTTLNLDFDEQYWVSIEVESDGEMTPRTPINSVGYAYASDIAFAAYTTTTAPLSPSAGDLYYDTDDNNFYLYNNSSWEDLTGALSVSTTLFSIVDTAYFGGTATSTFGSDGALTMASNIISDANNTDDLGSYGNAWKDLYVSSTAYIQDLVTKGPVVDVRAYGAVDDSSVDSTAAIQAAIDAAYLMVANSTIGGAVYIPAGHYLVTDTLNITNPRIHIYGDGKNATYIQFDPASGGLPAFHFSKSDSSVLYQNSIRSLSINGVASNTLQKIGLQLTDTSEMVVEDISMLNINGDSSVGIKTRGRDMTAITHISIRADYPIVIANNPNRPEGQTDVDHLHVQDAYLIASSTYPNVTIEDGVTLANVTFDGYQAWALGGYGLRWVDTTTNAVSINLSINNVRWEQSTNASGYIIDIEHNWKLLNLSMENIYGGLSTNGIKLRNVYQASIKNYFYVDTALVALDVNTTTLPLLLENVRFQTGSTYSFDKLTAVMDAGRSNTAGGTVFSFAVYDVPSGTTGGTNIDRLTVGTTTTKANPFSVVSTTDSTLVFFEKTTDATNALVLEIGRVSSDMSPINRTVDLAFSDGPNKAFIGGISAIRDNAGANWQSQLAFYTSDASTAAARTVQGLNERMRITSDGNIGMGTTTPWARLSLHGLPTDTDLTRPLFVIATSTPSATSSVFIVDASGDTTLGGELLPDTNNLRDLGSYSFAWKSIYTSSTAYLDYVSSTAINIASNLIFPVSTTDSNTGVIYKGGDRFIHNFSHPTGDSVVPTGRNTFIGLDSGNFTMGSTAVAEFYGSYNTAIGYETLKNNAIGYYNTAIGYRALKDNTNGANNVAIGWNALVVNTTGNDNLALGYVALANNSTGLKNTALGYASLYGNTNGGVNTAIGDNAGRYIDDGTTLNQISSTSLFIGANTKASASGVYNENVIGYGATGNGSNTLTLGNNNIVTSWLKGTTSVTVSSTALLSYVNGSSNNVSDIGAYDSAWKNIYASSTSFLNYVSSTAMDTNILTLTGSTTDSNTGVIYKGDDSFIHNFSHPTGDSVVPDGKNTFVGLQSGNFTMGSTATQNFHGTENTGFGVNTLSSLTTGYYNLAAGTNALQADTSGNYNVGLGKDALFNNLTGVSNMAVGASAMYVNTSGHYNTAIGQASLFNNTSGQNNVAIGKWAGRYIANGINNNQTSGNSLYIGTDTRAFANGDTNEIVIGYAAIGNGSNTLTLGNDSMVTTWLKGTTSVIVSSTALLSYVNGSSNNVSDIGAYGSAWKSVYASSTAYLAGINASSLANSTNANTVCYNSATGEISYISGDACSSSLRKLKENIIDYSVDMDKLMELNTVTFNWIDTGKEDFGLIADDAEKLFPELTTYSDEGELMGLNYGKIGVVLIEAVQKIWKTIISYGDRLDILETQQSKIDTQQSTIDELKAKVNILMSNNNLENQSDLSVEEPLTEDPPIEESPTDEPPAEEEEENIEEEELLDEEEQDDDVPVEEPLVDELSPEDPPPSDPPDEDSPQDEEPLVDELLLEE